MPVIVSDRFVRPGCGLVNGWRAQNLGPDEFAYLQNVKIYNGNIVTRGGTVAQGSAPASATVRWLFHAYGTDVTTALVVRLALIGTALYYKIGSGAWTSLKTGLTAGTYPSAVAYKGHVYWCDGTNTPQDITIANPPTITDWVTMPSGINPTWVVLHLNKLKYGGDKTTPNFYYQTEFGTPGTTLTTSFYLQPDDQNGNYPKVGVNIGRRVGLFCQDYLVAHSGAGPNTDQFFPIPRGAACVALRSVVDMGEFGAFYLTENGVYSWDGNSPPEPVDANGRINFGDIDLTTETDTWAMRVGDEYRLYFKSKGNLATSTASASAVVLSSTSWTRFSSYFSARTYLTQRPFVATGATDRYYSYDCRRRIWTGPHTGTHSCGAWEQYRYGDTQDPWVGSSAADGKVFKADQQSAFTDDSTTPIECIIRTGVIGSPYRKTEIERIVAKFGALTSSGSTVRAAVWKGGSTQEPPAASNNLNVYQKAVLGRLPASTMNKPVDNEDSVTCDFVPEWDKTRLHYLENQIEYRYAGGDAFEFRGHEVTYKVEG